jgi:lysophospholipase L1-like esterase
MTTTPLVLLGDSFFARLHRADCTRLETASVQPVINAATGGMNSRELVVQASVLADLDVNFIISIGMNDAAPWKCVPLDEFRQNIEKVVSVLSPQRVAFLVPPPVSDVKQPGPDKRNNETLTQYAAVIHNVARETNTGLIDCTEAFRMFTEQAVDYHTPDGVHLNDVGGEVMLGAIMEYCKKYSPL